MTISATTLMHDGSCRPFTINRPLGREVYPKAWKLPNGKRIEAERYVLGWRVLPIAYNDDGIQGAMGVRRSPSYESSPFGAGSSSLPRAICNGPGMLTGPDKELLKGSVARHPRQYDSPHPKCTCGIRIVHDVKDAAKFYFRHREEYAKWEAGQGVKTATVLQAVRGGGYVCRSVEFKNFADPEGTVRTEFVAMDTVVLLDSADAHVAPMFEAIGITAHVIDNLAQAHEANRCRSEYEIERLDPDPAQHALRINPKPGKDGGTYFTRSGEWGHYGAAGTLLKTSGKQPRYLLQQRSYGVSYGGLWSIPGGARHANETAGETAARELSEEMGIEPDTLQARGVVSLKSLDWTYQTIIAEAPKRFTPKSNSEVAEAKWLSARQVRELETAGKLHPLFEAALDDLLA